LFVGKEASARRGYGRTEEDLFVGKEASARGGYGRKREDLFVGKGADEMDEAKASSGLG
jgi:hypothetical protein